MSAPRGRPRVALEVVLTVEQNVLNLITVHCSVHPAARAMQRGLLAEMASRAGGDVRILLGDFNEWHVWNATFQALRLDFGVGPTLPTFPAVAPALALDRIWVRPSERLIATHVDSRAPARYASDHLPVIATIAI
jgi:endonuclease/exonuclease/phosphatase family metal-dependent hydrolase